MHFGQRENGGRYTLSILLCRRGRRELLFYYYSVKSFLEYGRRSRGFAKLTISRLRDQATGSSGIRESEYMAYRWRNDTPGYRWRLDISWGKFTRSKVSRAVVRAVVASRGVYVRLGWDM